MTDSSSLAQWIDAVRNGAEDALQSLWVRFDQRFIDRAYSWSQQAMLRTRGQSAYRLLSPTESLFEAIREQKLPKQRGENELWRILATVTLQEHAEAAGRSDASVDRIQVFASLMGAECLRMINLLADSELESLVLWKLEGDTNDDVALRLRYTRRTIQRMLRLVRDIWEFEIE
jgi:hypothetical protein